MFDKFATAEEVTGAVKVEQEGEEPEEDEEAEPEEPQAAPKLVSSMH